MCFNFKVRIISHTLQHWNKNHNWDSFNFDGDTVPIKLMIGILKTTVYNNCDKILFF